MKTTVYRTIPCLLVMALYLSGCACYVGGDLRNTESNFKMPACTGTSIYQVTYKSDARDDPGKPNIASVLSGWTLGIMPTYWTTTVHSEATVFHNGDAIFARRYQARIHKFYGFLWGFILPS